MNVMKSLFTLLTISSSYLVAINPESLTEFAMLISLTATPIDHNLIDNRCNLF